MGRRPVGHSRAGDSRLSPARPRWNALITEPFADATKLRASFGTYQSLIDPAQRTGRAIIAANDTPTLILVALADPCCYPAFGQHAAIVFARHTGPFGIPDAGHFPQWEAAKIMNDAIAMFCADRLGSYAH